MKQQGTNGHLAIDSARREALTGLTSRHLTIVVSKRGSDDHVGLGP